MVLTVLAGALLAGLWIAAPTQAAQRDFEQRFTVNTTGNITFAANTLMTCDDAGAGCVDGRDSRGSDRGKLANNNQQARYVDVDGDSDTFASSASDLVIPEGSKVLYAALYWSGDSRAGRNQTAPPNAANRNQIKFKVPGGAYETLTAETFDTEATNNNDWFSGFVNVTDKVAAAGPGQYWAADLQAATGADRWGGWSLVVAYENANEKPRNLTIFDGLRAVRDNGQINIRVEGFKVPPTGDPEVAIGLIAGEGDLGSTGDAATLISGKGNQPLSNAIKPRDDFFNSTISRFGEYINTKDPNYKNQYGYDANLIDGTGKLANGEDNFTLRLQTAGDAYLPFVVTTAIELFAPKVVAEKSVQNLTRSGDVPARPGDRLRYTVRYTNDGGDDAVDLRSSDAVPAGTTYVPGTTKIGGAGVTDAAGDDTGEFSENTVKTNLGAGSNATDGGTLSAGSEATYSFEVTVNGDAGDGTTISNTAVASFRGGSSGIAYTAQKSPTTSTKVQRDPVPPAPPAPAPGTPKLEIEKVLENRPAQVGKALNYRITVRNTGNGAATGVVVTDQFDGAARRLLSATPTQGECNDADPTRCTLGDLAAGATATVRIVARPTRAGELKNSASVTAANAPAGQAQVAEVVVRVVQPPKVGLRARVQKKVLRAGERVGIPIRWTNTGPGTARNVRACVRIPRGFAYVGTRGGKGRLRDGRVCWTVPRMKKGQKRTGMLMVRALNARGTRKVKFPVSVAGTNFRSSKTAVAVRVVGTPARAGGVTG